MTNEKASDNPATDPNGQPPPAPPANSPTTLEGAPPDDGKRKPDATKNEADELAREFRAAEKWVIGTNVVLAIIGIFALCIYNGQLNVMRGQLGEIIKQSPEIQKSADAAKSAADTAASNLEASERQFRDEQRPYVWFVPGIATAEQEMTTTPLTDLYKTHTGFGVNIRASNGGHSPAVEVRIARTTMIFDTTEKAMKTAREWVPHYGIGEDLPPNTIFYVTSPPTMALTADILQDLKDKRKKMYVLARIQYRDIFLPRAKTPYETALCIEVLPTGIPFGDCTEVGQSWIK